MQPGIHTHVSVCMCVYIQCCYSVLLCYTQPGIHTHTLTHTRMHTHTLTHTLYIVTQTQTHAFRYTYMHAPTHIHPHTPVHPAAVLSHNTYITISRSPLHALVPITCRHSTWLRCRRRHTWPRCGGGGGWGGRHRGRGRGGGGRWEVRRFLLDHWHEVLDLLQDGVQIHHAYVALSGVE